ncbi:MAG: sugar transferase [Ruminococcus sp.]|nr:sugar transferase [Ruminococcus sp.]
MNGANIAVNNEQFLGCTSSSCDAEYVAVEQEIGSGVKEYPVLDFDEQALDALTKKVEGCLQESSVRPGGGRAYRATKRVIDIAASLGGLMVLAVPMGIVALAIYCEDKGNPIFSQVRLTENGKTFRMYKFRSMCTDAEARFQEVQKINQTDGLAFKSEDDPRITKIGKFIRKTSIDEFPQLLNVLRGDMSLIGPRPPLPREVNLYSPHQMERLLVKGGLSCYCQCNGRSDMPFDEWVNSDIQYIEERSLKTDIKLLFQTVKVVLCRKGAR